MYRFLLSCGRGSSILMLVAVRVIVRVNEPSDYEILGLSTIIPCIAWICLIISVLKMHICVIWQLISPVVLYARSVFFSKVRFFNHKLIAD